MINAVASERNDAIVLAGHFANVTLADGKVDALVEALARGRMHDQALQYIHEIAAGRPQLLIRYLQDPAAKIRLEIVDAIGLSGDGSAQTLIEPLAKDRDAEVAKAAERAMARLRGARAS